jgi:hypothetical protein
MGYHWIPWDIMGIDIRGESAPIDGIYYFGGSKVVGWSSEQAAAANAPPSRPAAAVPMGISTSLLKIVPYQTLQQYCT